jgi:PHD/YefM family antitoxin component YafN of YafNO toxin-antitoxin module
MVQYTQYFTEDYKDNIMVSYGANELISSSDFAKKFGSYLLQIKENSVEKLAILKNNKVEAVLVSKKDYEAMSEALKKVEADKIITSIKTGLDDVKKGHTKPISTLWNELDN